MLIVPLLCAATVAAGAGAAERASSGAPGLDASYVGVHRLRVNRTPGREWTGTVTITRQGGALHLEGGLRRGPHYLELSGTVEPVSARKFHLEG